MAPVTNRIRAATAADIAYLERHEVVSGEIVEKAGPGGEHAGAQYALSLGLGACYGRGGNGRPGGWWLLTEIEIELERHEVYVPDIAGWRIERVPERPRGRPVRVIPDWVCEILSPSTTHRDLGHKQRCYHRARVAHYWILDPLNLALTAMRWAEGGYQDILVAGPEDRIRAAPFEEIELDLAEIFGLQRPLPPNQ